MDSTHLEEWLSHEHTQALASEAERTSAAIFQRLRSACRQSTDPAVREAAAQYEAHQQKLELLKEGRFR